MRNSKNTTTYKNYYQYINITHYISQLQLPTLQNNFTTLY